MIYNDLHPLNNLENSQILFSLYFTNYAFLTFMIIPSIDQAGVEKRLDLVQMLFNVVCLY